MLIFDFSFIEFLKDGIVVGVFIFSLGVGIKFFIFGGGVFMISFRFLVVLLIEFDVWGCFGELFLFLRFESGGWGWLIVFLWIGLFLLMIVLVVIVVVLVRVGLVVVVVVFVVVGVLFLFCCGFGLFRLFMFLVWERVLFDLEVFGVVVVGVVEVLVGVFDLGLGVGLGGFLSLMIFR